ncbi:MAG: hypothetical protein KDB79_14190 [Acidobacteria bacterium]|nr:hypothetical protein [Acidobacteriota bacterium]
MFITKKRIRHQTAFIIAGLIIGVFSSVASNVMVAGTPGQRLSSLPFVDRDPREEVLWDFTANVDEFERPREFSDAEKKAVMKYLFGNRQINDFEIARRLSGSFTRANADETLYYVGGCDDGDGFKTPSNCSRASSWNAGWIALYEGNRPVRKIEAALGYRIRFMTDVNNDDKFELLSLSGYSGMGETSVQGELGQITQNGYEKIFPLSESFFFGSLERITFSDDENVKDKCFAIASAVSYTPTTDGTFPVFKEEYFKSDICDSNWRKLTKEQFDAEL